MPTAKNLIKFAGLPVYNKLSGQFRFRDGVDTTSDIAFLQNVTAMHQLPPFIFKIPVTAVPVDKFRVYDLSGTLVLDLDTRLLTRVNVNEGGTIYTYVIYYGNRLTEVNEIGGISYFTEIDLPCGPHYATVTLGPEVYYTEVFKVLSSFNLSEDNIVTNGEFEFNLNGWVVINESAVWEAGRAKITVPTVGTQVRMLQNLPAEPAPWVYKMEIDIEIGPSVQFRVDFTDGLNVNNKAIYTSSGIKTLYLDNPKQIRFGFGSGSPSPSTVYINYVRITKVLNVNCYSRFVWGNTCTMGEIPYSLTLGEQEFLFSHSAQLSGEITTPEYPQVIEDSVNEVGARTKDYESLEKRSTFIASPLPPFLVDALMALPLHNKISYVDTKGEELVPDYTVANEPEALDDDNFSRVKLEMVENLITNTNCCNIIALSCPTEVPDLSATFTHDTEDDYNQWRVAFSLSFYSGYGDALFELLSSTLALSSLDCVIPPTGYTAGAIYTAQQIMNGEADISIISDNKKRCYAFRIILPQCPEIDGQVTNLVSFIAEE